MPRRANVKHSTPTADEKTGGRRSHAVHVDMPRRCVGALDEDPTSTPARKDRTLSAPTRGCARRHQQLGDPMGLHHVHGLGGPMRSYGLRCRGHQLGHVSGHGSSADRAREQVAFGVEPRNTPLGSTTRGLPRPLATDLQQAVAQCTNRPPSVYGRRCASRLHAQQRRRPRLPSEGARAKSCSMKPRDRPRREASPIASVAWAGSRGGYADMLPRPR